MSDQIVEEYQEQVLEDLSDIKESVTTDSGYQEKVLDDLHDIKESVSEEQEYYDKEYQKKVLGSLRSIQKSVETLNVNYISIDPSVSGNTSVGFYRQGDTNISYGPVSSSLNFYAFNIKDHDVLYLSIQNVNTNSNYNTEQNKSKFFTTNSNPETIKNSSGYGYYSYSQFGMFSSSIDKYEISNVNNYQYLIISGLNTSGVSLFYVDDSSDDSGDVTSGSAVMVDGIDTLIQITTFQGFASALLTGILLFLVFVKGLRR